MNYLRILTRKKIIIHDTIIVFFTINTLSTLLFSIVLEKYYFNYNKLWFKIKILEFMILRTKN